MKLDSRVRREDSALALLFVVWGFAAVMFSAGARAYSLLPSQVQVVDCPFKRITGYPCATCGSTRTFALLGGGRILAAMKMNPLVFGASVVGVILAAAALGAYAGLWPFPRFNFVDRHKSLFTALLIVGFMLNWVYLIWSGI